MTTPQLDDGPVPLSFPAILRSANLSDRFAHLRVSESTRDTPQPRVKKERTEPEGKRWIRRRENAKFTHNPHIAPPTSVDFAHPLQLPSSTFPHPLPSYLPRSVLVPPARAPPSLPHTSSAGLFSLSLRGARQALRARPSSPYLVKAIEAHLAEWLQGGTYLNPDRAKGALCFPGDPVGGREDIREVAREASRLVWTVGQDPALVVTGSHDGGFERYVVHCVARWYGVVSFSKETDGCRLTYLLRPNVARPDPRVNGAPRVLDTPPTTDASDFHASDASDVDSVADDLPTAARPLSDIEESRPSSPASWSVVGGSDFTIDSDDDADERDFAASMESLSLSTHAESGDLAAAVADTTLTPCRLQSIGVAAGHASSELQEPDENPTPSRARTDRDRLRGFYPRSTSSPSPARRSPHRLPTARKLGSRRKRKVKRAKGLAGAVGTDKGTFYDYLFA